MSQSNSLKPRLTRLLLRAISITRSIINAIPSNYFRRSRSRKSIVWDAKKWQKLAAVLRPILPIQTAIGNQKIRVGPNCDSGYVMLDQFDGASGTLVSCGLGRNCDFEYHFAKKGWNILLFDHTVKKPPRHHKRFNFYPQKIGPTDNGLTSLEQILNDCPKGENTILKIDIEGGEWPLFATTELSILSRFTQIIGEFHNFQHVRFKENRSMMAMALASIAQTHVLVHIHGNNYSSTIRHSTRIFPNVAEMTFLRKDLATFTPNTQTFPTTLDYPCCPKNPDLNLGQCLV